MEVPKTTFYPRPNVYFLEFEINPKVDASVIRLVKKPPQGKLKFTDLQALLNTIFAQPRKTLYANIKSAKVMQNSFLKLNIDDRDLSGLKYSSSRASQLDDEQIVELFRLLEKSEKSVSSI